MSPAPANRPESINGPLNCRLRILSWLAIFATVALLPAAAAGCGGSAPSASNVDGGRAASSLSEQQEPGEVAPDFSFTLLQGSEALGSAELNVSDLKGKPVVLNFWAGLCPPCRAEMPDLQEFDDANRDEVTLVGIDIGQFMGLGTTEDAEALLQDLNITYPAGFTTDEGVVQGYKVLGMPTTVFINPDGTIFKKWTGALNRKVLDEQIQRLMDQQK